MLTLNATIRDQKTSADAMRLKGLLPVVCYGKDQAATALGVTLIDFQKVWREAGESTTVTLAVDGKNISTLIHDVSVDPVTGVPIHADFLAIDINKPIRVHVPIEFTGEAPAVKSGLGTLAKVLHEIEIEALPKNMPHAIEVDMAALTELGSQIHVKDLSPGSGVTILTDGEEVVAAINAIKEESEEPSAPLDLSAIEISEKKGKKDEEDTEAAAE